MLKKIAFGSVGIILLATPVIVSAQSLGLTDTCSASPTIACLQNEIQELVQILNQLLSARGNHHPPAQPSQSTLSATPTSGSAPLTVNFSFTLIGPARGSVSNVINYGDGSSGTLAPTNCTDVSGGCTYTGSHTYANPGTYSASASTTLWCLTTDASGNCTAENPVGTVGSATVTVGNTSSQLSATIDQSSLATSSLSPTITGTASGVSSVYIQVTSLSSPDPMGTVEDQITVPVTNGLWSSGTLYGKGGFTVGTYTVSVENGVNGPLLARDTLTINGSTSATITYVSNTATTVTASYANLPVGTQVLVINQTSGHAVSGTIVTASGSGTVTLSGLTQGTFYVKAADPSGNYLAQSVSFTASGPAQTSAPTCTLTANPTTVQSGSPTTLTWSSTSATSAAWIPDPSGKDNIPPTGTPGTSGSISFTPPTILIGSYNPSEFLQVTGAGGTATCSVNLSVVGSEQAAFDNGVFTQTSPTPTISGTASGVSQVRVVLSVNNAEVYQSALIQVTNGHWSVAVSPALAAGTYFINVYDANGNVLVGGGYLNVPSQATFTAAPASGTAPLAVTFSSNVGGLYSGYAIDFGDNSFGALSGSNNSYTATHTYSSPGTYTAKLEYADPATNTNCFYATCNILLATSITVAATSTASTAQNATGTCTRTVQGIGNTPTTISVSGGASACSAYCSSQDLEDNVHSTCVYNDLSVSGSGDANLANALIALQAALQELTQWLGK